MSTRKARSGFRRLRKIGVLAVGALALATLSVLSPASAVVPTNDNWQTATSVTAGDLPYTNTVDTTDATKDAAGPPTRWRDHSVWYHLRVATDRKLFMRLVGTSDTASLRLYHAKHAADSPDTWTLVNRASTWGTSDPVGFVQKVNGGEHYYLMVSNHRGYSGGTATLNVRAPAHLTYSMAKFGKFAPVDGSAVVHGMLTASRPTSVEIYVQLRQAVGDHVVRSGAEKTFQLTTTDPTPWTMRISAGRPFKAGRALITANNLQLFDAGVFIGEYHFARTSVTLN